jgi:hypothetical protein
MGLLRVLSGACQVCWVFSAQNGLVNFPNLRIFSDIRLLHKVMEHLFLVVFRGFWASLRHVQILAQKFAFLVHKKETGDLQFEDFRKK